ncbi:hypothetical protein Tco_1527773 [Tanacetum coccineum]
MTRSLGAYDLGVTTPRALVYASLMTSGDARSRNEGGKEADIYRSSALDQDLFQQANVVDEEDYTNIVDEEVVDREEHVVEESQEKETVDEIDAIDESEFDEDEIPPIEPHVDE